MTKEHEVALQIAIDALEVLARLGTGGDAYGNSKGNEIARIALTKSYTALNQTAQKSATKGCDMLDEFDDINYTEIADGSSND